MLHKGENMSKWEKNQKMSNEEGWSCCALPFDIFPEFRDRRSTQKGKINLFPSKCLPSQGVQSWLQAYAHACTHNYSTCGRRQFVTRLLLTSQWWELRVQLGAAGCCQEGAGPGALGCPRGNPYPGPGVGIATNWNECADLLPVQTH